MANCRLLLHTPLGLVTFLYVLFVLYALDISMDIRPFAMLALTAAYAILMLLLWLYERFPPARSP